MPDTPRANPPAPLSAEADAPNAPITILIADDHPIVRSGLRRTIEQDLSLQVIAEVDDGEAAVAGIRELQPAVAVLDIDMPRLDGFGVARAIQAAQWPVRVLFLTIHADADLFHAALDLGALGYILKQSAVKEIAQGLRAVASGQYYVSPALTGHLVQRRQRVQALEEQQPGLSALTPAERRILSLIAAGRSSKEIGAELSVHYRTVDTHRTNICQKLGLNGPHALMRFALQHKAAL